MIRMDLVLAGCMILTLALFSIEFGSIESVPKINGACLVSPPHPVDHNDFVELRSLGTRWVAIIPYAFVSSDADVIFDHPRMWWGERTQGTIRMIEHARSNGLKVMLKPHLWVRGQGWAGDFELLVDEEWQQWEKQYRTYLLHFVHLADSLDVEMVCVGTELRKSVQSRPQFWSQLIGEVRSDFSGKITYAANWDNYHQVDFWDELDFIGIDAYFPLDTSINPTIDELKVAWEPIREDLKNLSQTRGIPILFTEYGYRSVTRTAGNHWELDEAELNMQAQVIAYQALYNSFWDNDWFAGGFFWKWHLSPGVGGIENSQFTPQGKPGLEVIRTQYTRYAD